MTSYKREPRAMYPPVPSPSLVPRPPVLAALELRARQQPLDRERRADHLLQLLHKVLGHQQRAPRPAGRRVAACLDDRILQLLVHTHRQVGRHRPRRCRPHRDGGRLDRGLELGGDVGAGGRDGELHVDARGLVPLWILELRLGERGAAAGAPVHLAGRARACDSRR
eukprot:135358-Chlamydomonas_euryale.AAC.2